jgi:DNA-binding CsgD family transcriptional regulator
MKHSKSMAYLRQLCCLGLGKDVVIPEFLDAVREVIPSNNNLLTRQDENGMPVEVIFNLFLPDIINLARELIPSFHTAERLKKDQKIFKLKRVLTDNEYAIDNFFHSDMYHLVWKPCEQHYLVQVPIFQNQRTVDILWLFRPSTAKPFTTEEQKLAAQLSPYLTHALQKRPDAEITYVDSGQSSLIIANTQGEIVYLGKDAERLLTLATQLECYKAGQPFSLCLPPALVKLCQNLDGIFKGEAAMPPVLTHSSPYGRFVFRGYWLDTLNREPSGLVSITIEHQEPQDLAVMRGLKEAGFSPVQTQVCLLVTQGLSNEQISAKLHIKLSTVKDHIHKILLKMDIQQRTALLPKLLEMGKKPILPQHYARRWH